MAPAHRGHCLEWRAFDREQDDARHDPFMELFDQDLVGPDGASAAGRRTCRC